MFSLFFRQSRLLNIRSLNYCCLVNASWQLCYKCRLPVFIVGSLVNVRRRLPKNLQMTGMPKSGSSLLATRSWGSVIGASHHIWANAALCLFSWNLVKDDTAGMKCTESLLVPNFQISQKSPLAPLKKANLKREKKHFPSVPTEINKSESLFYQSDVKCWTESADK